VGPGCGAPPSACVPRLGRDAWSVTRRPVAEFLSFLGTQRAPFARGVPPYRGTAATHRHEYTAETIGGGSG
jgi:hypothetical protein